jgi:hypothetical protein
VDIPGIGKVDLDKAVQFTTDNARSLPVDLSLNVNGEQQNATMVRIGETIDEKRSVNRWETTILFDPITGEKFRRGIALVNGERMQLILVDSSGGQLKVIDSGATIGGGDLAKLKGKVIMTGNRLHSEMVGPGQYWYTPKQIFVIVVPGSLK